MSLPLVPLDGLDERTHTILLAQTLNKVLGGRANNVGTLTLTANVASTTVLDNQFESSMVPVLIATTANAATATANVYVSARANGSFTLTHANNAQVDRTFLYIRWG